jgi:integrase
MALRKKNGKWHYRFQVDRRTWSASTGLKATKQNTPEAQKKEVEARELVMQGRDPNQRLIVRKFSEATADFLMWAEGEYRAHPNSYKRIKTSFASLTTFFGGAPVGAVEEGPIEDFKSGRRRNGILEVSIRHDLYALSTFFEYAKKQRWAARNPVREIKVPSDADAVRMHVLTPAEGEAYFRKAKGNLRDVGRLIILQGCRPDEVVRLRHTDIDLFERKLHIRWGKTNAARKTLTLMQESMQILARRLNNGSEWVFPSPKCRGNPIKRLNTQHDAVLFKLNHDKVDGKWVEKPPEKQIQFVLYDLRHTFATRMAQEGVDLATLAATLGHNGLRAVIKYVHPTAEHQEAAMLRYDEKLTKGRASFGPVEA